MTARTYHEIFSLMEVCVRLLETFLDEGVGIDNNAERTRDLKAIRFIGYAFGIATIVTIGLFVWIDSFVDQEVKALLDHLLVTRR